MDAGKLPAKVAAEVADLPPDKQHEVIEKIEAGQREEDVFGALAARLAAGA